MSAIEARFRALRERRSCALVPFVTAGDPDLGTTEALIPALADSGADLIEIGVPFSDPVAEGPTIQRASERALAAGTSLPRILDLVKRLRSRVSVPLILMGYANPFLRDGPAAFARAAADAGVDGLITADLPPEEEPDFFSALRAQEIDPIFLASPTTPPERAALLATASRGFLYYVSLTGVTGARDRLPDDLVEKLGALRRHCPLPVCVGFGISTPAQAAALARHADGVVVGSALVDRIAAAADRAGRVAAARDFLTSLRKALP